MPSAQDIASKLAYITGQLNAGGTNKQMLEWWREYKKLQEELKEAKAAKATAPDSKSEETLETTVPKSTAPESAIQDSRTKRKVSFKEPFDHPRARPETPPQPFATIPFSRDPDFVNRGDVLDQIDQRCSEQAARLALVGLGGVGKSQLAMELAHRMAQESKASVFWIHAGTQARVEEGFVAIAKAIKLPDRKQLEANIPQLVHSWLSNERNGGWFMILDGVEDHDVFYGASGQTPDSKPWATYLPQNRNGSILITTRDRNLAHKLIGGENNILEIGAMMPAEALSLLEKKLGPPSDMDAAAKLVRALDYVPLAICQAAGYIQARMPQSSPEKYLREFLEGERKRVLLLGHDGSDLRRDGSVSNAILTTWQISFEHIRSERPSATKLLSLMSFLDRQVIPDLLLKNFQFEGQDAFKDDVAMLKDYCLVSANETGDLFVVHSLVQLATRNWFEAGGP